MVTRVALDYWSDCFYRGFLSLYPTRFRRHFGVQMSQSFRDCCRSEAGLASLIAFWIRTLKDISFSVPLEWRREMERPDCQVDYTGLVDAFMITIVVGTNLIGWG